MDYRLLDCLLVWYTCMSLPSSLSRPLSPSPSLYLSSCVSPCTTAYVDVYPVVAVVHMQNNDKLLLARRGARLAACWRIQRSNHKQTPTNTRVFIKPSIKYKHVVSLWLCLVLALSHPLSTYLPIYASVCFHVYLCPYIHLYVYRYAMIYYTILYNIT